MRACVRAGGRACGRACVRAGGRAYVRICVCACPYSDVGELAPLLKNSCMSFEMKQPYGAHICITLLSAPVGAAAAAAAAAAGSGGGGGGGGGGTWQWCGVHVCVHICVYTRAHARM